MIHIMRTLFKIFDEFSMEINSFFSSIFSWFDKNACDWQIVPNTVCSTTTESITTTPVSTTQSSSVTSATLSSSSIPPTTNSLVLTSTMSITETPEIAIHDNEMDQNNKLDQNGFDQGKSQIVETSFDRKNKRKDFNLIENRFITGYTSGLELPVGFSSV